MSVFLLINFFDEILYSNLEKNCINWFNFRSTKNNFSNNFIICFSTRCLNSNPKFTWVKEKIFKRKIWVQVTSSGPIAICSWWVNISSSCGVSYVHFKGPKIPNNKNKYFKTTLKDKIFLRLFLIFLQNTLQVKTFFVFFLKKFFHFYFAL